MISPLIFYGFCVLYLLSTVTLALLAVSARSALRFLVPAALTLGILVPYFGLDYFVGRSKPVHAAPLWHTPTFGPRGATVLGGRLDGADSAYILLQEAGEAAPRLYYFGGDHETVRNLKQAMQRHAAQHAGEQWGFEMSATDQAGPTNDADVQGQHGGFGGMSLDQQPTRYTFGEPAGEILPPKETPPAPIVITGTTP